MKKLIIIAIALVACQSGAFSQELSDRPSLRLYGSFGLTNSVPILSESGTPYKNRAYRFPGYKKDLDTLSYGGGIQILFSGQKLRMGLDIGFLRMFNMSASEESSNHGTSTDYLHTESAARILLTFHYSPSGIFFMEGGIGPQMVFMQYQYEHSEDYGWKIETYDINKKGAEFNLGLMLSMGADIPVSKSVSIPVYARADYLFRYGSIIPVTLNTGIKIRL